MAKVLLSMASWEPRFLESAQKEIADKKLTFAYIVFSEEYESATRSNREKLMNYCSELGVVYEERIINLSEPSASFFQVKEVINSMQECAVHLDITTMTREIIWFSLHFLKKTVSEIDFVYYKPAGYSEEWLTRSPGVPRLVLKHSGITKLNTPTALVVTTGFDNERTKQLVSFYDPAQTQLAYQVGTQFNSLERTMSCHEELDCDEACCHGLIVDAYGDDYGFSPIEECIEQLKDHYNIVLASLGPKPSAVAAYMLQVKYPEVALAYTPSGDINPDYSHGLGKRISGVVKLSFH